MRCAGERASPLPTTVAPATDIAMSVGQLPDAAGTPVPESGTATAGRLRRTLVGGAGFVSRMPAWSPDGMALGKAGGRMRTVLGGFPTDGHPTTHLRHMSGK
ncbi:hypothetical protein GCM10009864_66580 [Streptomyces lunalinharesii]|uniref:Uncharacterized protein n=1 Tax=Streptomyces lunalinharesii TaxID=333384 RepID=A0ABN3SRU3_9ACTN